MNHASTPPAEAPRQGTQALDRAIALLRAVADADPEHATVAQLASTCGLNKATAWRLLSSLESQGMVDRDASSGHYTVGYGVVELAGAASYDGLVARVRPILRRVSEESGETANLAVFRSSALTYIDEIVSPAVISAQWLSRSVPLHATSTGKALLAWLPAEEAAALIGEAPERFTDTTITDPEALAAELENIRTVGYATCDEEYEVSLNGVSAPVLGRRSRPLAIISVWGPVGRVPQSRFAELGHLVRDAAAEAR